jgi:hypothetical protein
VTAAPSSWPLLILLAVVEELELHLAAALLVDGLDPGLEDFAPGARLGGQGSDLDRFVGGLRLAREPDPGHDCRGAEERRDFLQLHPNCLQLDDAYPKYRSGSRARKHAYYRKRAAPR